MLHYRIRVLVPSLLAALLVSGCGDTHPTGSIEAPVVAAPTAPPLRSTTGQDAFAIADPYYVRDILAPFGSNYDAFFDDPEVISDAQFEAQGPYSVQTWETDPIEGDATAVNEYCGSVSGGGGSSPDPFLSVMSVETTIASWESCEEKWTRCWDRCRRLPALAKQARALCWGACAASYALCVRRRRGG
jgi:hypothetical protein